MQPENETPTEPIQAQSHNNRALNQAPEARKSSKAPWAVAAVTSVLAIAGIAFGIYGMMKPAESPATDNLKVQIKNTDGTTTTLETDKIEKTDNGTTVTIVDSISSTNVSGKYGFTEDNFLGEIENTYSLSPETTFTSIAKQSHHSMFGAKFYLDAKGEVSVRINSDECGYYGKSECENGKALEKTITSSFSGKVVNLAVGQWGNGGVSWIIAVLEDGTAESISEFEVLDGKPASKIEGAKDIVFAYGDQGPTLGYLQDSSGKIHTISVSDGEDGIDFSVDK